jgi:hypothetical protein
LVGWLAVFCFDWQLEEAAELTQVKGAAKLKPMFPQSEKTWPTPQEQTQPSKKVSQQSALISERYPCRPTLATGRTYSRPRLAAWTARAHRVWRRPNQ